MPPVPERPPGYRVLMTVWCGCGTKLGDFWDRIEEKYPFWCGTCEETTNGKYPWRLDAQVIAQSGRWQSTTSGWVWQPEPTPVIPVTKEAAL
jgi:hypothetical protein